MKGNAFLILPGTGRGTSRRLVEGVLHLAVHADSPLRLSARVESPLHHAASRRGLPPRAGEDLEP